MKDLIEFNEYLGNVGINLPYPIISNGKPAWIIEYTDPDLNPYLLPDGKTSREIEIQDNLYRYINGKVKSNVMHNWTTDITNKNIPDLFLVEVLIGESGETTIMIIHGNKATYITSKGKLHTLEGNGPWHNGRTKMTEIGKRYNLRDLYVDQEQSNTEYSIDMIQRHDGMFNATIRDKDKNEILTVYRFENEKQAANEVIELYKGMVKNK